MSDLFRSIQTALADQYQLERELGRGGMATVFLARDLKHPRRVAIKVLRPELAGVMTRGRFLREIRISSELAHPHILPLLDSGTIPPSDDFPALPFYTMPFVEGESLRDRLKREQQLPIDDALQIAGEVAAALGYAHSHDVVHRDIKPENILLMDGHAVVADFGIARAIKEAVDPEAVTSAGIVIGTPAYMSPEQAAGKPDLDGRSDVYSLGCVVYEMLGGEPPFTGASPQAVLARHRMDHVPSLRTLRTSVPPSIEQAVMRALEKTPADRFATAAQFAESLHERHSGKTTVAAAPRRRLRSLLIGVLLAVAAGAAWYGAHGSAMETRARGQSANLDTTRYAILAFGQDSGVPAGLDPVSLLQDAMARWGGIALVDPFQVRDIVGRRDTSGLVEADWRRLAAGLGAGRYVRGNASRVGDSIRVHAVLYDASMRGADPVLHEHTVRIPLTLRGADSLFAELADGLLLRDGGTDQRQSASGTRSLPARQAYEQGSSAINDWDLGRADSGFSEAVRHDAGYAQAYMWLALVRSWSNPEMTAAWRSAAERAAAGRAQLSARDRRISDALLALSHGDAAAACTTWGGLTREFPYDFVVWFGLGECLRQDDAVVPDRASPTHWRFRSSYHQALNSYQRAYGLMPTILRAYREASFASMTHQLLASGSDLRLGHGLPPDSTAFLAAPSWEGDTLVLFPVPLTGQGGGEGIFTATSSDAVQHQRQQVYEIARAWVAEFPADADALQALAISLELLGDRSALDTIVRARELAIDPAQKIRVTAAEVWMRVLLSAPTDLKNLRIARRLADTVLALSPPGSPVEPQLVATVAALAGRAHRAAELGRRIPEHLTWETPPALAGYASTFLTYAAMGGPGDSLLDLERRVTTIIDRDVLSSRRTEARALWLALPARLAFPEYQLPSVASLSGEGDLVAADAAFLRGDTAAAWRAINSLRNDRAGMSPADITIDAAYPEAWLMDALGQPDAAAAWLDSVLDAMARAPPQLYTDAFRAGMLVRAMAFRAELAARMGNRATARKWAAAVVILWSDADDFLQPLVERMKVLAR